MRRDSFAYRSVTGHDRVVVLRNCRRARALRLSGREATGAQCGVESTERRAHKLGFSALLTVPDIAPLARQPGIRAVPFVRSLVDTRTATEPTPCRHSAATKSTARSRGAFTRLVESTQQIQLGGFDGKSVGSQGLTKNRARRGEASSPASLAFGEVIARPRERQANPEQRRGGQRISVRLCPVRIPQSFTRLIESTRPGTPRRLSQRKEEGLVVGPRRSRAIESSLGAVNGARLQARGETATLSP